MVRHPFSSKFSQRYARVPLSRFITWKVTLVTIVALSAGLGGVIGPKQTNSRPIVKDFTEMRAGDFHPVGLVRAGADGNWIKKEYPQLITRSFYATDVAYFEVANRDQSIGDFWAKTRIAGSSDLWTAIELVKIAPNYLGILLPPGLRPGDRLDLELGGTGLSDATFRVENPTYYPLRPAAGPSLPTVTAVAKRVGVYVVIDVSSSSGSVVFLEDCRLGTDRAAPNGSGRLELPTEGYLGQIIPNVAAPTAVDVWANVARYATTEFIGDRAELAERMRMFPERRYQEFNAAGYWCILTSSNEALSGDSSTGKFRELMLTERYPLQTRVPVVKGSDEPIKSLAKYRFGESSPFADGTVVELGPKEAKDLFKLGQPNSRLSRN